MQREFKKIYHAQEVMEGAGVRLKRGFSFAEAKEFDPFLLFDDFSGDREEDYVAGFPRHPHRGMETVTYILEGSVRHKDSLGNEGTIGAGDIQWMNAGSGILHEEMPETAGGKVGTKGFQLWVNLPKDKKMSAPQYRDIKSADVPVVEREGMKVRVLGGSLENISGPVSDVTIPVTYLDVTLTPETPFSYSVKYDDTLFVYVMEGSLTCRADNNRTEQWVRTGDIGLSKTGNTLTVKSGKAGVRFFLIAGTPLKEPIAWRGPIVMNTEEELARAWEELQNGSFVKH